MGWGFIVYLEDNSHQTSLTEQISNHKSQLRSTSLVFDHLLYFSEIETSIYPGKLPCYLRRVTNSPYPPPPEKKDG